MNARLRAWVAALTKGAWARGVPMLDLEGEVAELVDEPPRPGPRAAREVQAQPHELERGCRNCGTFHDAQPFVDGVAWTTPAGNEVSIRFVDWSR